MCQNVNLDPYLISYVKINSKRIKNLNVKPKTQKDLKQHRRKSLCSLAKQKTLRYDINSTIHRKENL